MHGLPVQVVRKAIKNLNLGVHPANGRVRVAAPLGTGDDAVRLAVTGEPSLDTTGLVHEAYVKRAGQEP